MRAIIILAFVSAAWTLPSTVRAGDPSRVDAMVAKSLPYIEAKGEWWRERKGCHSCHRTTFTVWSLNRAAESGLSVDESQLTRWNGIAADWTSLLRTKGRETADRDKTLRNENDAVGQLLMGRPAGKDQEWVETFREQLVASQQDDGSWKAGGQLPFQKRPKRETIEVSTMWAMIALNEYKQDESVQASLQRGHDFLGKETKPVSTEWLATRLLVERMAGANKRSTGPHGSRTPDRLDQLRAELLAHQNEDGGWGWIVKDQSDALGTAYALYALARDGVESSDSIVQKAIGFLESTQADDGSWLVKGTKEKSKDKVAETASYWGTTWAVIAMLEFDREAEK